MLNGDEPAKGRARGLFDMGGLSDPPNMDRFVVSSASSQQAGSSIRVAALDDDPVQLDLVAHTMQSIGYGCHCFKDGSDLLRALRRETFDLLILDWQLPGLTGPDIVLWVREHQVQWIPIIFVTNRSDERDIVKGFAYGVDDYMLKPLRVAELIARVRAQLRRGNLSRRAQVQVYGRYSFDASLRVVCLDGQNIELKDKEFALAQCLFANLGRLMSRQHLVEAVWGFGASSTSRVLDSLLSVLRNKLRLRPDNGFRLSAVYSVGYRLEQLGEPDAGPPAPALSGDTE
ncbi:DNA-binding response OmpR family regulator [Variovorax boronicumulans]|uniref:response regulator transcription factor n=1 Tax=Variovorax boronicumulans TaxID=436515 RepID=UPI0027857DFB|nr:response regulator transcription factor [Variovorax boronicumulans]MDQ0086078.1 DNA-binding response OmpR family regulator [Variovorax boronicumulans]